MKLLQKNILYIAWVLAIVGTLGSLYFSEILKFTPCSLCWYQRIFLYPLVFILPVGILKKDRHLHLYVLPLTIIGGGIALFHTLLYYHIIPETYAPCTAYVSCTTKYIELFGFMSIPLMALLAFGMIAACMVIYKKGKV